MQPRKSHFFGSSTGGEVLQVVQRYPLDTTVFLLRYRSCLGQRWVYLPIKLQRFNGGWLIPPAKIAAINQKYGDNDATDGVVDGLISNYLNCNKRST